MSEAGAVAKRAAAPRWALERIAEVTEIPFDKRADLDWLRSAVSLAHSYARAALLGREPPAPPDLAGQMDLFGQDPPPNHAA